MYSWSFSHSTTSHAKQVIPYLNPCRTRTLWRFQSQGHTCTLLWIRASPQCTNTPIASWNLYHVIITWSFFELNFFFMNAVSTFSVGGCVRFPAGRSIDGAVSTVAQCTGWVNMGVWFVRLQYAITYMIYDGWILLIWRANIWHSYGWTYDYAFLMELPRRWVTTTCVCKHIVESLMDLHSFLLQMDNVNCSHTYTHHTHYVPLSLIYTQSNLKAGWDS